jgi:hypothetical protein
MIMKNELERVWKEAVVAPYLWHYAGIFMEVPREGMRNFTQNSLCIVRV